MLSTFETRLATLLKKLEAAAPCDSAETAFALFHHQWLRTHEEHDSPAQTMEFLRSRRLSPDQGWEGVGSEVAYLDSSEDPHTRIYLHRDGSIVVQHITAHSSTILFSKPGRPHKPAVAACPDQALAQTQNG